MRLFPKLSFCPVGIIMILLLHSSMMGAARIRFSINDGWTFFPAAAGSELPGAANESGQRIDLPHTWNVEDAFDDEPGYARGARWYSRELNLSENFRDKRLFLYFEGANHTAEVFINGEKAGTHVGGYTAFAFDVTNLIEFGKPNSIAVRVDNSLDKNKPPIDGDFTMYGGIYRDVWLIATDAVHFEVTDHAAPGVTIETPKVSTGSATVRVSGTIVNAGENAKRVEIVSSILDGGNVTVAQLKTNLSLGPRSEKSFAATSASIEKPRLWSPDDPYLYKVKTEIRENGKILDEIVQPLGFRWFRFDAAKGFFLNGKPLKLRGTNRHQDYEGLGNAVPDEQHARDLEIIKKDGFNFLRLAHYPQDPAVLAAADRLGLLVWEEIPIVNQIHVSPEFNENAKQMLREMIRQHRNHPSIILWGYMNEVFLPVPKTDEVTKATVELAKELEKIAKTEDASRATAIAFDHGARELYHTSGLGAITDVIGWNLYHGWYYETFEDFGKFLDDQHRRFPTRPLIVSEYGANGDRRLHSAAPKRFDSTIEWQRMFHEAYLPQIESRPFVAGGAIWNQFDFGSEFRGETIPHLNQKGIYTYDREPKDIAFYYKAHFSAEPVMHIAARDWQRRSGASKHEIDVYTNFDSAELFRDGASLGTKTAVNRKATWTVDLKYGKNSFAACRRGSENRKECLDTFDIYFTDTAKPFDASFRELAVNVGSNADFTDESKTVWTADKPFEAGGWGFVGENAKAVSTGRNVFGTLADPLYQTMLEGLSAYRFDVPDGEYEVELKFVETKFREPEKRVFSVSINGQEFLTDFDPAKRNGFLSAASKKKSVPARDGKGIVIEFTAVKEKAVLSAVKIKRLL